MSDKQIYDRNMDFLRRVPLEDFFEHLVRALRAEERKTMATVEATQTAIARFQAAVDARETAEQGQIATQISEIADLSGHVVPDSLVQQINDAAAKIEAQNSGAQGEGVTIVGDQADTAGTNTAGTNTAGTNTAGTNTAATGAAQNGQGAAEGG